MSLLDDARRLAEEMGYAGLTNAVGPVDESWSVCVFCDVSIPDKDARPHKEDCPNLAMPKIVAALKAAEAVSRAYEEETVATWGVNFGSPLLKAVDALDKAMDAEAVV